VSYKILDGKLLAQKIEEELRLFLTRSLPRPPALAFILVGEHAASHTYVRMKQKRSDEVGILSKTVELKSSTSEKELMQLIHQLNQDPSIDGILVQMPLPKQIDPLRIMAAVDPEKDVDGFHPLNVGKLLQGDQTGFVPCTPLGVVELLHHFGVTTQGKHAVIVGRSQIVGKPLAALLMQKNPRGNATVTVAHSQSEHLEEICKSADILIAALGSPRFITKNMIRKGAAVVDVGINRITEGDEPPHLVGDVDFAQVAPLTSWITPVPGGVGPLTIAMLLSNTLRSFRRRLSC